MKHHTVASAIGESPFATSPSSGVVNSPDQDDATLASVT
jgi:hypothetical protein